MLPSVSLPMPTMARLAAIAAPVPALEPQGLRSSAYGSRVSPPRPLQPELDWVERKLAHLLRLVLPRITAPALHQEGIAAGTELGQGQRAGAVDHRQRVDVVLEQHRNAMWRPADMAGAAFGVQGACVCFGLRIEFDHRVERGACAIDAGNAL